MSSASITLGAATGSGGATASSALFAAAFASCACAFSSTVGAAATGAGSAVAAPWIRDARMPIVRATRAKSARHVGSSTGKRLSAQPVALAAPACMSTTLGRSRRGTGPATTGEAPSCTPASPCIIVLGDSQPADDCLPAAGDGPSPPPSKRRRGEAKPGDGDVVNLTGEEGEHGAGAAKPPLPRPRARPSGAPFPGAAACDCDDVIFVAEVAGKPPAKKAPGPAVVDLTRDPPTPSADAAVRARPSSPNLCACVWIGRVLRPFASLQRPTGGHTTKAQTVPRPPLHARLPHTLALASTALTPGA